jgi:hypothetical protein
MNALLVTRLAQADVSDLPDWAAAAALNAPDAALPVVVTWERTNTGVGSILHALGPQDGAVLLDNLATMATTDVVLRWGLLTLERGVLDLSLPSTRAQIDALVIAGAMTTAQRDALFLLSRRERHPSWAEANNINVDARAVGIARGAKE